jgi:hypothetical protein
LFLRLDGKLELLGRELGAAVAVVVVDGVEGVAVVEAESGVGTVGLVASVVEALLEGKEKLTLFFSSAGFSSFFTSAPKENEGVAAGVVVLAAFSSALTGSAGLAPNVNPEEAGVAEVAVVAAGVDEAAGIVGAEVAGAAGLAPKEKAGVAGTGVASADV